MRPLKVSTEVTVRIGPFVDKTDGVTEETGLAGAGTELSKNGAAFGAGPTLGTHDAEGWYPITLTTTHTNTVGDLVVKVHDSATHLPVRMVFTVLPALVYDSIVAGTDNLQVDAIQVGGTTQTARDIGLSVLLASDQAVNVTKWGGTAVASAYVQANTAQFAGQTITCAGGVTIQAGIQASQADVTGLQGSVDGLYSGVPCTSMSAGVITAAAIATGAIDADAIADNAIDAGAIATGAITAAKFASAAIDAAAIAPDAGTEIGTAVWASAARTLTAATNITSTGGSVPITVGGKVEADVKAINAVTVDGAGTGGNPWGPA